MNVLFLDGHCLICNRLAKIVLENDETESIKISHLQGEYAQSVLPSSLTDEPSTVVFMHEGILYKKSDAVFKVLESFGGMWRFFKIFKIIPRPIRDYFYMLISYNRYRIGEKLETCPLPPPEYRKRFIA